MEAGIANVGVGKPIRRKRSELVQQASVQRSVHLALLQPGCGGILIVFDSDDDCRRTSRFQIEAWAKAVAGSVPCRVVMAHREYEAWFLASLEALRGVRGIVMDAANHTTPEAPRNAKGELRRHMIPAKGYSESVDQAAMTAQMNFAAVYRGCRSFRKMVKSFGDVMGGYGSEPCSLAAERLAWLICAFLDFPTALTVTAEMKTTVPITALLDLFDC